MSDPEAELRELESMRRILSLDRRVVIELRRDWFAMSLAPVGRINRVTLEQAKGALKGWADLVHGEVR